MDPHRLSDEMVAAAGNLRIDAATAEVVRAFDQAGVRVLLLKGPSTARWLYGTTPHAYADSDLLVEPSRVDRAGEALEQRGFARIVDKRALPDWWQEHATEWWRASDGVVVDLHRRVPGVGCPESVAWSLLLGSADTMSLGGQEVPVLSLPARALNVAIHAAHHGSRWGPAMADLHRALAITDEALWRGVVELARELDAVEPLAAGLRLSETGSAMAMRLGLPAGRSVGVALRASTPPPVALGFEQLAAARSHRARAAVLARKIVPPPAFIRHWWPRAAQGPGMLFVGYLYRPVWLLRRAPAGWRAWRAARRAVGR